MTVHTQHAEKNRKCTQNFCRNTVSKDIPRHTEWEKTDKISWENVLSGHNWFRMEF